MDMYTDEELQALRACAPDIPPEIFGQTLLGQRVVLAYRVEKMHQTISVALPFWLRGIYQFWVWALGGGRR